MELLEKNKTPLLLLTRPHDSAAQDTMWFAQQGIECLNAPMLEYTDINFEVPDIERYQGIILTSAQSVRAMATKYAQRYIPLYCVGDQSAQCAKELGYSTVKSASGTAADLIKAIKSNAHGNRPYLYARGENISIDIQAALLAEDIPCDSIITYKAELTNTIPELCVQAIKEGTVNAIAFTSVRGAQSFSRLVCVHNIDKHLKFIKALCLSPNVLECIQPMEWADACVCPHPDGDIFRAFIRDAFRSIREPIVR